MSDGGEEREQQKEKERGERGRRIAERHGKGRGGVVLNALSPFGEPDALSSRADAPRRNPVYETLNATCTDPACIRVCVRV